MLKDVGAEPDAGQVLVIHAMGGESGAPEGEVRDQDLRRRGEEGEVVAVGGDEQLGLPKRDPAKREEVQATADEGSGGW